MGDGDRVSSLTGLSAKREMSTQEKFLIQRMLSPQRSDKRVIAKRHILKK